MASPNLGLRKRKKAHTRQRLTYVYPEMAAALEAKREPWHAILLSDAIDPWRMP